MKYIDAELLKTELKRLIKERDSMMKLGTYFSTSYVYEDILELIDSLQQEQEEPVSEDLEEAARRYVTPPNALGIRTFKAGAEWQAKRSPLPEDTLIFRKGVEEGRRLEREDTLANLSYNELMELYKNIRDEIRRREEKK